MPSRNVVKVNVPESYYHVYARGISKQQIFLDEADYHFFLSLFGRYLSRDGDKNARGSIYQNLSSEIELLAYCVMKNHFHLLVYQIEEDGMARLMHGIMATYSRYFNKKYGRSGPLFESRYKAVNISSNEHLLHISRYIHLNPEDWLDYPYSSIRSYLYDDNYSWIKKSRVIELYGSAIKYLEFLNDFRGEEEFKN